ncbi:MAG: ABC transporter permease [Rhizobiales bacterium]|nr:ABC transporter permease [Hyphomicrobiales bacterium]
MRRGLGDRLTVLWTVLVISLLYMPIISVVLASLANTRYMRFPHRVWSIEPYREAFGLSTTWELHSVSLKIALAVAVIAALVAIPGALAFARFEWRGRSAYQKLILLPVFFPQPVLGLALLVFFSAVGVTPSWKTAVFAHLVLIAPIVTLIVSITLYGFDRAQEEAAYDLGATRLQAFREVTLPAILPGLVSGGLFAFLLSWSNLPLSAFTTGADSTLPEWLYSRTATNYAPMIPAVSVISVGASAAIVLAALFTLATFRAARRPSRLAA